MTNKTGHKLYSSTNINMKRKIKESFIVLSIDFVTGKTGT